MRNKGAIDAIDRRIVGGEIGHGRDERPSAVAKGSQLYSEVVGWILVELLETSLQKTRRTARGALSEQLVKGARDLDQSLDEETPLVVGLVDPDRFPGLVRLVVFALVVKTDSKRESGLLRWRDGLIVRNRRHMVPRGTR